MVAHCCDGLTACNDVVVAMEADATDEAPTGDLAGIVLAEVELGREDL